MQNLQKGQGCWYFFPRWQSYVQFFHSSANRGKSESVKTTCLNPPPQVVFWNNPKAKWLTILPKPGACWCGVPSKNHQHAVCSPYTSWKTKNTPGLATPPLSSFNWKKTKGFFPPYHKKKQNTNRTTVHPHKGSMGVGWEATFWRPIGRVRSPWNLDQINIWFFKPPQGRPQPQRNHTRGTTSPNETSLQWGLTAYQALGTLTTVPVGCGGATLKTPGCDRDDQPGLPSL